MCCSAPEPVTQAGWPFVSSLLRPRRPLRRPIARTATCCKQQCTAADRPNSWGEFPIFGAAAAIGSRECAVAEQIAHAASYHPTDTTTGRYREPVEGTPFGRYRLIEML